MTEEEIPIYDLLVIGAGPVGLATALAAHRRGCRSICVVDQTRGFGKAGDNINVNPNGIRALRIIAPELADKLCGQHRRRAAVPFKFADSDGNQLYCRLPGETETFDSGHHNIENEPNVGTTWYFVQKLLLDAVPDEVYMRTNTQFISLQEEQDGCVRAEFVVDRIRANPFAHWENDPAATAARVTSNKVQHELSTTGRSDPDAGSVRGDSSTLSLRARVVVGADGINSRLRGTQAQYSGFVSLKSTGKGPVEGHPVAEATTKVVERYFGNDGVFCMVGCRRERAPRPDAPNVMLVRLQGAMAERLGWEWKFIVHAAVAEETTNDPYDAVMKELRDAEFPPEMLELASHMLKPGDDRVVIARPLYVVPISEPPPYERAATASVLGDGEISFGSGRVVLAGDSLHGMPPFISQGTSMGWEDVVELIDMLAKTCNWNSNDKNNTPTIEELDELRERYREVRTERIAVALRETLLRRWAWDETGFAVQQLWLRDFVPKADGWKTS